jgi:hypothetical protein
MEAGSISARSGYGETTRDAPANAVPISSAVNNALESARSLAERIVALSSDFLGPVPTDEKGTGKLGGGGRLRALADSASDTEEFIRRAHRALDRLNETV